MSLRRSGCRRCTRASARSGYRRCTTRQEESCLKRWCLKEENPRTSDSEDVQRAAAAAAGHVLLRALPEAARGEGLPLRMVGKGLLKDENAQKLALQHWLEAIDPRHRYGHNLHCYYDCWLHSESKQPFFYWLDVGEGREMNLEGKCSRSKLLSQCIKYFGPSRLDVDVKNEGPSKDACTDIIKRGVRQTRYNLKRKYFEED